MVAAAARTGAELAGMPVGRRTPRGRKRWYLAQVPEGREDGFCEKVKKIIPGELLEDAFVMRKEIIKKVRGEWIAVAKPMHPEYFVVVTRDVAALDAALRKLTFPVKIAKGDTDRYSPVADEASAWYERMMDETHTIRKSTAHIVGDELQVKEGPLVGQESRILGYSRSKCRCTVAVTDGGGGFVEVVPLAIPCRS